MESTETKEPEHPSFAAFCEKHPEANPDNLLRYPDGAPPWLKPGTPICVDDAPATVIRLDTQLQIMEYAYGDC